MKTDGKINLTPVKFITPSKELEELQGLMPISKNDFENLKNDIKKTGAVRDPVKCYQDSEGMFHILAGFNRWKIAIDLAIDRVPVQIYEGTKKEYKDLVINDNLNRRHLTTEDKKKIAREYFKIDPEASAREIADKVKISDKTAGSIKKDMQKKGEIAKSNSTRGKDNKVYNLPVKPTKAAQEAPQRTPKAPAGNNHNKVADNVRGLVIDLNTKGQLHVIKCLINDLLEKNSSSAVIDEIEKAVQPYRDSFKK